MVECDHPDEKLGNHTPPEAKDTCGEVLFIDAVCYECGKEVRMEYELSSKGILHE